MRESAIEKYLVQQVKKRGGKAYKWVSPGNRGVPDRIVIFPNGRVYFVEIKAPGKKPDAQQRLQHKQLSNLGHYVWVVDSLNDVDLLVP